MSLLQTSAPAAHETRRTPRFDPPRPVKEAVKAAILKVKRIETGAAAPHPPTNPGASQPPTAALYLPTIHPSVVRGGEGTVRIGRGSSVGRRCELQARGGAISLGEGSTLAGDVRLITYSGAIRVGDDSVIVSYSIVYGGGGVTIGDHVLIGNHSVISGLDHTYPGRDSVARSPMREAPVFIGDDVWVGGYCLVMAGVTIGEGAIVGAHSLVRDDVPPFAVVAGRPARLVRMR